MINIDKFIKNLLDKLNIEVDTDCPRNNIKYNININNKKGVKTNRKRF